MALFSILLTGLAAGGVQTDQDGVLRGLAADAAAAVSKTGGPDLVAAHPLVVTDLASDTDPFTMVLAENGSVLYSSAQLNGGPPRIPAAVIVEALDTGASAATIHPTGDVELRVQASRWQRGPERGVAVAGQSTRVITQQLAGLRSFLTFSGIVTIIVVVIVSWLVLGRAMRPLRTLTATADEIGRTGDLGRRLPAAQGRDEVAVLTRSLPTRWRPSAASSPTRRTSCGHPSRRSATTPSSCAKTPMPTHPIGPRRSPTSPLRVNG
jgi:hypothetical protein